MGFNSGFKGLNIPLVSGTTFLYSMYSYFLFSSKFLSTVYKCYCG